MAAHSRDAERLTALDVPRLAKVKGMHHDGRGLYLKASPPGGASWILRYMLDGKAHTMGLGPFPEVSLRAARQKALAARQLKTDRLDPIATRRAERHASREGTAKALSFKQCAQAYIASHQAGWKNDKHAKQWASTLETYAYPVVGQAPIALVDNASVLRVLQQEVSQDGRPVRLWEAKPETASRLRGRLEAVLGWASAGGLRSGDNPARWKGQLEHQLPARGRVAKVEHHAALPYRDIATFVTTLRHQEGTAARALEFAILTAARTGEALGARWAEIDIEQGVWIVPAERMKARKEHRVPLSEAALAIVTAMLADREEGADYVFPGARRGKPLSNMAFLMLLRE